LRSYGANPDAFAALRVPELRRLIAASTFAGFARTAMAVVIGYQVYQVTKDPLALGILGFVEAIPSVGLALYGGHVADRYDRRMLVLATGAATVVCALAFMGVSLASKTPPVYALYAIIFLAGIARGFASPAASAFEAQVVPKELFVNLAAWNSSVWTVCGIVGPAAAGIAFAKLGAAPTYGTMAVFAAISWGCVYGVKPRPLPPSEPHESVWKSIAEGIAFVRNNQALYGSMMLDLFAVFFGGAIALLPIFATDILKVGPEGLGLLHASPAVGTLAVMLWSTKHPPIDRAGRNLLVCVAAFGGAMILFGLSRNLYLSMFALALSGAFDGVSMVIRGAILRLLTPEHLRGRVAAVNWVFIGSSNEFGALESGVAAKLLGATRAVWAGGVVCLAVVGLAAARFHTLRELRLSTRD
jgi:MFS family permease